MSDNIAVLDGYTEGYLAVSSNGQYNMFILVKPDTDFDSIFKAYDSDEQEFIFIDGCHWDFERIND